MSSSEGNKAASLATRNLDPLEPFEPNANCIIKHVDQYKMEEEMSAMEHDGVQVIVNGNDTFRLEGDYLNIEKAVEQLKLLKLKKRASRNTREENKEQTLSSYDEPKAKVERKLRRDLTPSSRQVDLSISQKIAIDQHVWYYLERKHPNKVDVIAKKHLCVSRVVYEFSNEGIAHSLEVAPYSQDDSGEARKHVDDAVEEFAQLYQKVSEPGIVKEIIKLPLALNRVMPQRLIAELEEMGVFLLRSDDTCLIGPKADIERAKLKVSDFISRHTNNPVEIRPNDSFGLAQASATDIVGPMNFKTPSGIAVYVSKGDLVDQSLDAIVNPANEHLSNGGGAARAIAKAAGYDLQKECNDYIRREGKLEVASVMHTSAGNLRPRIRYVIHTVGPTKSDAKDDEELLALVRLAIFNCINYADEHLKIRSLAIPAISSGIFGVPIEIVGRASFEAFTKFDEFCASSKNNTVREIYFLNKDEPTFSNMKRIFQSLRTHESSVDPEQPVHAREVLDRYADVFGRLRIETTPDENCFTRAFATALQRDFKSKLDWRKVAEAIRKELNNSEEYYKMFRASEEPDKQGSWADVVKNKLANIFTSGNEDKKYDPDVWLNAAANALKVQIVLVHLSNNEQEPFERNFKPRGTECDDTVYIAFYCCGHHHFDALVKKTSLEDNVSGDVSAETKNKWSPSGHPHNIDNGHSYTSKEKNGEEFEKMEKAELNDMPHGKASNVAGKNAAKEKASNEAGKKADDDKKDDDDNHCIICMDNITDKKELPCKHKFCRGCIDEYISKCQPKCPSCGKVFGTLKGDQPKGTMTTKESSWQHLAGYNDCGTIEIEYSFYDGIQGENHPNPGQPYRGTHRSAYLPANKEGREVLRLLKRAFDAKLVFTIGRSNTTGRDNVVIWNDVHHKTSPTGQYGYPDPTYLKRVKEELAAKGIQ